ncbi:MAG: EAL domain-containing protein, partial [Geobacteraceae bacterium]|nr:EAL domain-containing protein [Geobacteraceae bacterium]
GTITMARLLSEADAALGAAVVSGPNTWQLRNVTAHEDALPMGQQQWKEILLKAVDDRRIVLEAQPVKETAPEGRVMHVELFARIRQEDGTVLSAALFMPLAERLHLVTAIDRIVLEQAVNLDLSPFDTNTVAINLSAASLADESFNSWLRVFIKNLPADAPRFRFEFSEFSALHYQKHVRDFSAAIKAGGHGIGLDHYGQSFSKLGYLQALHPEYVKIDRAYTGELMDEMNDSRFYVSSLCSVAHSIDIAVVAEGVETEQQSAILRELNLDGLQGYFIGRPASIAPGKVNG